MAFRKGHRHPKQGGKRPGAGRPSREKRRIKKLVAEMARAYIEKHAHAVLKAYLQLAGGRKVDHYNQQTGEKIYTQWEVDGSTLRHWINKILADPPQEIDVKGKIAHTVIINTRDPDAEE